MHFITFPVASTNIFPLVNSKNGGQNITEFNLRAIDSVSTTPEVKYFIGPSYTHSMDDFEVSLLSGMDAPSYRDDATYSIGDYCSYNDITYVCIYGISTPETFNPKHWTKIAAATSILQISSGKAVINGHYFESLAPVTVDLTLANAQLKQSAQAALSGQLSIGLKSYYSTETTMAGSMLVENEDNMYIGVQIVILPKEQFITPSDSPNDRNAVTADLKLADFVYVNGSVPSTSIKQNANKISYFPAERIGNFENILSTNYISRSALDPNKLYVFSGLNGSDGNNGWCQAVDSLMVWDKNPQSTTDITESGPQEARFVTTTNQQIKLQIPHKQIHRTNTAGEEVYYKSKELSIPVADYNSGTPGTVTSAYTQKIKDIAEVINTYKTFVNGKQVKYIDTYTEEMKKNGDGLPEDISNLNEGDYIVVRQDLTVPKSADGASPSTMYVVLPGAINTLTYTGTTKPSGIELGITPVIYEGDNSYYNTEIFVGDGSKTTFTFTSSVFALRSVNFGDDFKGDGTTTQFTLSGSLVAGGYYTLTVDNVVINKSKYTIEGNILTFTDAPKVDANIYVEYEIPSNTYTYNPYTSIEFNSAPADKVSVYVNYLGISPDQLSSIFTYTSLRGSDDDYFTAAYHNADDTLTINYYWSAISNNQKIWSDAINLTGGISYATTDIVGGFLNIGSTITIEDKQYSSSDRGYVYLDDDGHLRLMDYSLLRSGTLAYQLGESYTIPSGLDASTINTYLNEYVNNRIAFPLVNKLGTTPNMIDIYINLPDSSNESIFIYNVDSRYGTGLYLHFLGNADSSVVVNIVDCEKVRIDSNISGNPVINVIRSNLFYDASVFNYIRQCDINSIRSSSFTGMLDISIWYDKFEATDPDLLVSGMEVSQPNAPMTTEDIDFWSQAISNDNHYGVALRSIKFDGQGDIVDCSLMVSNNTSLTNTMEPSIIGGSFMLPQGSDLNYPESCITKALKITGEFTTAYFSEADNQWIVSDTNFTALSGTYSPANGVSTGTISFYSKPAMIDPTYTNVTTIDGWLPGSYHIFYGGVTF